MTHLGVHRFFFIAIYELFLKRKREEHLRDHKVRLWAISISSSWVFKRRLSIGIILLYGNVPPMVSQWAETIIIFVRASVLHSIYFCASFGRIVTSERQLGFPYKGASLRVASHLCLWGMKGLSSCCAFQVPLRGRCYVALKGFMMMFVHRGLPIYVIRTITYEMLIIE